jgi:hypothetical protein
MTTLSQTGCLSINDLPKIVEQSMSNCQVIDLHTHLFPPEHDDLFLWGIDELLTYHYLVSEFFMIAPGEITTDIFFQKSKSEQADLVWEYLFVKRSPISEAQIGVLTTLRKLGLDHLIKKKEIGPIREWFQAQNPSLHAERVFDVSGVKYCVMTNIPFLEAETCKWIKSATAKIENDAFRTNDVIPQTFNKNHFRTALRIDPLLKGDWGEISRCLEERGLPLTLSGARSFLIAWAKVYEAEYLMASTPELFGYRETDVGPKGDGWPTATDLIDKVMIPVARQLNLPLAMKFGACRGMQPCLNPCGGGDGVTVADTTPLKKMCQLYPDVKFLATFLSEVNQHEVCVMSQKFRNLHIYGCWWYLNNPSMIESITKMRLELLGTAFTSQHSDARVMDQIIYKWDHSRRVIAKTLIEQFSQLMKTGWVLTIDDVEKDVERLLGGAYIEFLNKDL